MSSPGLSHTPVLQQEVLASLGVEGPFLDCTTGMGGHAGALLAQAVVRPLLVGLDHDASTLRLAARHLAAAPGKWLLVESSFAEMDRLLGPAQGRFRGVLLDLGYSSAQLDDKARGLSFSLDGPLDMRLSRRAGPTAADFVNGTEVPELASVIRRYGEERAARRIAAAVVAARPLHTTGDLARAVARVVPERFRVKTLARVFQAIRIEINRELEALEEALPAAVRMLAPGGRLAVISFHSLEDRIVKKFMVESSRNCVCPPRLPVCVCDHRATLRLVTRKPVIAGDEERTANPRSRSARLRVARRIEVDRAA